MDDSIFREKRSYPRVPINVEFLCSDLPDEKRRGKGILCFYSIDISVGGAFLETSVPLKIGSIVYLRFILPNSSETIVTQAKIVRHNVDDPYPVPGMGIEFQHLSFSDKNLIDDFVRRKQEISEKGRG